MKTALVALIASFLIVYAPLEAHAQYGDATEVRLTFEPRAVYLAALDGTGGTHAGFEYAAALSVSLDGPFSFVARGRVSALADLSMPNGEFDDTVPCPSTGYALSLSFCSSDLDGRVPVGLELGVHWAERIRDGEGEWRLGGELLVSGSVDLNFYERVPTGGGLGGATNLLFEYVFANRWGLGLEVGGRVEAGVRGSPFGAATAGIRFAIEL